MDRDHDKDVRKARRGVDRKPMFIAASSFLFAMFFFSYSTIPAGHCGIVDFFGSVSRTCLPSGFNFRTPFAKVVELSLQTQLMESEVGVPSKEGLVVGLEVSVLYHVDPDSVIDLYIKVGANYREVLLQPEIRSAIRDLTGQVSAKALYSEGREGLSKNLFSELNERLKGRGVVVEQVMLRGVRLPDQLQAAIQIKLQSEQESQRMEFVLLKETQEAQRKRIEAQGIADFQQIVSQGISAPLLEWKGIEATEKLAASTNAKVVLFGNPTNGLPTILGGLAGATDTSVSNPEEPKQGVAKKGRKLMDRSNE